jgi:DNA-binding XRE family transcriptional regulator
MAWNWSDEHARRLREARERVGLTQAQLAEKIGASRASVNGWENNTFRPRNIGAICAALELDSDMRPLGGQQVRPAEPSAKELIHRLSALHAEAAAILFELTRRARMWDDD